jgi:large-conductance mechanosensitive channel
VVIGKLMSALSTLLLLIVSSFPAVAMVFVYGGITWQDILSLLLCYITVAFFAGSLGICFSALFKRSTISTVVTYGVLIAVVAGTYFINKFSLSLSSMNISNSVAAYGFGENVVKPSSGNVIYLLLLNPAATFYTIINGQMGGSTPTAKMAGYFGMQSTGFVMKNWIIISIVIQLAIAALMIWVAIKAVEPVKRRRRQKKAAKKGD